MFVIKSAEYMVTDCYLDLQNETLIAIKAPLGTTLEVPDPDEVLLLIILLFLSFSVYGRCIDSGVVLLQAVEYPHRRFQILLRSTMGPIDLYLVR